MQNCQTSTLVQSFICLGKIEIGNLLLMEIKKQNKSNQNKSKQQQQKTLLQNNIWSESLLPCFWMDKYVKHFWMVLKMSLMGNKQNVALHMDIVVEILSLPTHVAKFSHCSYWVDPVLSLSLSLSINTCSQHRGASLRTEGIQHLLDGVPV